MGRAPCLEGAGDRLQRLHWRFVERLYVDASQGSHVPAGTQRLGYVLSQRPDISAL